METNTPGSMLPAADYSYVQVARGAIHVGGLHLEAGDGLKITDAGDLEFKEGKSAEVIVFDLPG